MCQIITAMKEIIFGAMLLTATMASAQAVQTDSVEAKESAFTIDAQLMSRGEIRKGGLPSETSEKNENKANFVIGRTRLSAEYQRQALTVRSTLQHQALWGMEEDGTLSVYEAWAQMKAKNGLFARVGRQLLTYDDQRILGNDDWSMVAMAHDGLKFGYDGHSHQVHAFLAYNQNAKNVNGGTFYTNGAQIYKTMQMAWYHCDVPKVPLGISLILMNIGMQSGTDEDYKTVNQQLMGGYLSYSPKNLKVEAACYHQTGKACLNYNYTKSLPINSWMASVKAAYTFSSLVTAYAGYDYLSGDKEFLLPGKGHAGLVQHTEITAFTSAFGSLHKFYGAMDFFYVSAYYSTFSPGLQNVYGGVEAKPMKNLSVDASYHYLSTSVNVPEHERTLGHELEFTASYQVMKDVSLSLGYSFMKGSSTMEALKRTTNKRSLQWAWLMVNVSPRIFSTKK